jgi:hypothetical protein
MNPATNPFAPGAGTPPPEFAGRDELLETAAVAVERIRCRRPAKSLLMVGLRGVGKTVLLNRMARDAEPRGVHALRIEARERRSLPALIAPELRQALLRLDRVEKTKALAQRSLRGLAGFFKGLRLKYQDLEVGLDAEPEAGLADNGDLEQDLAALFEVVGSAAAAAESAVVFYIDELQYVVEDQLSALISALHRCAQRELPITLIGAGLPQLRGMTGKAKSYAERLFEFVEVGPLDPASAERAIVRPLAANQVSIEAAGVARILSETRGYAYFLQEWGKHSWDVAQGPMITLDDVSAASREAVAKLDESFFRVRLDRLTPSERRYVRAMAELGPGPHRSGAIAECLGRKVTSLAPTRTGLITKGMIWSPAHGDTAFTVPLFDEFMSRAMPGDAWRMD